MVWYRIDRVTGQEEIVTEQQVRDRVDSYMRDTDLAITAAVEGIPIRTPFAMYECRKAG